MPRRLSLTILAIADQGDDLRFSQKFALRKRLQDRLMKAFADPVGFALMLLSSGCARRHLWQGKKGVGAFAY